MKMSNHSRTDWCHLCGRRGSPLTDVWYGMNAEHDPNEGSQYIRICVICSALMLSAALPSIGYEDLYFDGLVADLERRANEPPT